MKITRSKSQTQSFLLSIKTCLAIFWVSLLISMAGCSSPLLEAVKQNKPEEVKTLLSQGTNLEVIDKTTGGTPLYIACQDGHEAIVNLLLAKNVNVNARTINGWTPLMASIAFGHIDIFNKLINKGAGINQKNAGGGTPLYIASYNNRVAMVKTLLSHKADIDAAENDRWTPLMASTGLGHIDIFNILINNGADINQKNAGGGTPLYIACYNNRAAMVKTLLSHKADTEAADNNRLTCLYISAERGSVEIVELLLAAGADIEARGWGNQTPLHRSASGDHMPVFTLLIENGAEPKINQRFHGIMGKTHKMLGDYHNERNNKELAVNAYEIAVQQFLEEATACERAVRVQGEQAENESALNTFISIATAVQARGNAYSSPFGFGVAANPLYHTVNSYETMSYAQKAERCRIWADECKKNIKLLQN